jgi:hypothetical protein
MAYDLPYQPVTTGLSICSSPAPTAYDDPLPKRGVWDAFFQHRRMPLGVLGRATCMNGMEKFLFPFSLRSLHRESLLTSSHTEVSVVEVRCGGLTSRSTSSCRREAIMQHIEQNEINTASRSRLFLDVTR